jgi:hypothetical protein
MLQQWYAMTEASHNYEDSELESEAFGGRCRLSWHGIIVNLETLVERWLLEPQPFGNVVHVPHDNVHVPQALSHGAGNVALHLAEKP